MHDAIDRVQNMHCMLVASDRVEDTRVIDREKDGASDVTEDTCKNFSSKRLCMS